MKSAYIYDTLSTEIYGNSKISNRVNEAAYGLTNGGIVTDCSKHEVRVKAIAEDRFGFVKFVVKEGSSYAAYEPHIRNESWTSVQLSNHTKVFGKATLDAVVQALDAKQVVKLASLERGSTDRNMSNAISGVAHAAAAANYHKAAREYAGMTRDIISGNRTTGSKAGDVTLGILGAIGAAAAMSEYTKEVERSSASFSRIRW